MGYMDLGSHAQGLSTEMHFRVDRLLKDYSPKLSLRRIGESDPALAAGIRFDPPRIFGVWEEPVARGETNWVFTLADISITPAVLVRVAEADFAKISPKEKFDQFTAREQVATALRIKARNDVHAEAREEMMLAGRAMRSVGNGTARIRIGGEEVLVGDTITPVRKFIR